MDLHIPTVFPSSRWTNHCPCLPERSRTRSWQLWKAISWERVYSQGPTKIHPVTMTVVVMTIKGTPETGFPPRSRPNMSDCLAVDINKTRWIE